MRIVFACCSLLLLDGCWDRTEINDYAFWMGTALDTSESKKVKVSAQIAIPKEIGAKSKKDGTGRSSLVISAEGNTLLDTCQTIQNRLPRRIFIGHRRAVFISERLAREGLGELMDMYSRNAELSLRSGMFVVVGRPPEEILSMESPFDPFSSDAILRQDKFSKIGDVAVRDLFVSFSSEGTSPILSAIDSKLLNRDQKKNMVDINKLAVFNKKMQMVGLLNNDESMITLWIINRLRLYYLTCYVPEGKGYVTIDETNLSSTIKTNMKNGKPTIQISLKGVGTIRENLTEFDLSNSSKLALVESAVNRYVKKLAEDTMRKVQENYSTDIFGLGEEIHEQHPNEWKSLRHNWEEHFHGLDISVNAQVHLKRIGVYGPRPQQGNISF
ncbi:Ger(x)C family spore germination protein [Paenibacillus sp. MAH-36]|uniref:Ger(X)C family spore germination protein n=1 Tax=Paenibacillus violae TaxID=3077234 RepID=A0ABU3RQL8_9BACL|nr:Ger(x)C family spore germination protein [Paenibacillus sp. PFR10]MDU0206401.1 Ger(x)C family spore germination protein [Paenibacillus sp. PFR10]